MTTGTFDALTRRASLMKLGAAGIAALTGPITAAAKQKNKKGDVNKRCKQQVEPFTTLVRDVCAASPDPSPTCLDVLECATPLKSCNFSAFLTCVQETTSGTNADLLSPGGGAIAAKPARSR